MYTLLYNRSSYSILSSCLSIDRLTDFAWRNGYQAVGLIDQNVMYGVMEFQQACSRRSLKPLYGLEINVTINERKYPYVLLARNLDGFRELMRVSSQINAEHVEYDRERLEALSDNLFIIDVCYGGYLEKNIRNASETVQWYKQHNIFIGLKPAKGIYDYQLNSEISNIAFESGLTPIAMPLGLYENEDDFQAYRVFQQLNNEESISESNSKYGYNLLEYNEYSKLYDEVSRRNAERLADLCNVDITQMEKASLPDYRGSEISDKALYLRELAKVGLRKRFDGRDVPENYYRRLLYEVDVINSMGFENYFLIVWDIIRFARNNGINVGIGRGSAAGSLVAYCLGITHIDPIRYGLLFERFLNPERISLPDIDIDIPDDRRSEVIDYVRKTYGDENVGRIVSFNTFAARAVINDVGSALGIPDNVISLITRNIPENYKGSIKELYQSSERFAQAINSSDATVRLYDIACRLEGLPRGLTTHPAGIVIASKPLINYVPLTSYGQGLTCQYEMSYLEGLGLIKIDLLALRNLKIINDILDEIPEKLNMLKIDLEDRDTYEMLCHGDTTGIFQLESEGMRNLIHQVQPHHFTELVDIIALYRPGPMKFIPDYVNAKKSGRINYVHPDLKEILEPTYGVMIYQEQVMQASQKIAGFSYGKADILRKAISKKNESDIQALRNDFIAGALSNGYDSKTAEEIFRHIERFAEYGFNKSHSVAYASTSYQQAYLKTHYPLVFYKTVLNDIIGNKDKSNQYLSECRKNRVKISGPDVNRSAEEYMVVDQGILAPLTIIKGLDRGIVRKLIQERDTNGLYRDFTDFICRGTLLKINEDQFRLLILSGSCDCFKLTRATMLANMGIIITYGKTCYNESTGLLDYSLASPPAMQIYPEMKDKGKLENSIVEIYINGHPVEEYKKDYPEVISSHKALQVRGNVKVIIKSRKIKEHYLQESGTTMCFIDGEDETGNISLAIMPELYGQVRDKIKKNVIYYAEGDIGKRDSIRVRKLIQLD